jgi:hypothetical protein
MKAKEILEVIEDINSEQVGVSHEVWDKWEERLKEAVYSEIAICLSYSSKEDIEKFCKSIASFLLGCYSLDAVELVLKLVNTPYEHLILDSIERYKNS